MASQTPRPRRGSNPSRRPSAPDQPKSPVLSPSFKPRPLRPANLAPAVPFAPSSSDDKIPCVDLANWWLEESRDGKIRVGGFKLHYDQTFASTPIVKRYNPLTLGTEAGFVVYLHGSMDISQTIENGYSSEVCGDFVNGFPFSWESCKLFSPASTISREEQKAQFYFKAFQLGKNLDAAIEAVLNIHKSSSGDDSDHGISTKERSAAFNDHGSKGSRSVCSEVDSGKINLIVDNTLEEQDLGDTGLDMLLAPTEEPTSDGTSNVAANQSDIIHPDERDQEFGSHLVNSDLIYKRPTDNTPSSMEDGIGSAGSLVVQKSDLFFSTVPPKRAKRSSGIAGRLEKLSPISHPSTYVNQGCLERTQFIAVNEEVVPNEHMSTPAQSDVHSLKNPVGSAKEQRSVQEVLQATRSPRTRCPIPYLHNSPLTRAKASTLSTPESLKLARTRSGRVIVPALDPGSQRIVYGADGLIVGVAGLELQSPLKGNKSGTPVARKKRAR